jgi:rRNA biogenesis protein RRP5
LSPTMAMCTVPKQVLIQLIDVETIEKMAILEFRHGEAERGKTLFEGLMDRYPKRLDLWSVYIDQLAKTGDIQGVR